MMWLKGSFVARNPLKCKSHNLTACCAEEPTVVLISAEREVNHNKPAAIWAQKPQTDQIEYFTAPFSKIQNKLDDFFWFNS